MLLIDQVDLLRANLEELHNQHITLPLMGGRSAVRDAYRFSHLIHPARDIITTIKNADPQADKLPVHLCQWNLKAKDEYGQETLVHLKYILGMIIHVYYLHIQGGVLDVSNDSGKHVIVPYDRFMSSVGKLILSPEDTVLVICHLAKTCSEKHVQSVQETIGQNKVLNRFPSDAIPGLGDFSSFLFRISHWPGLLENIWERFFAAEAVQMKPGADVVNNRPYNTGRSINAAGEYTWGIGWRRDDVIATVQVDVIQVIDTVLDHIAQTSTHVR